MDFEHLQIAQSGPQSVTRNTWRPLAIKRIKDDMAYLVSNELFLNFLAG